MYWHSALTEARRHIRYRAADFAGILTSLVGWGFIRAFLFLAVLGARASVADYNREQMLLYVGLTQALFHCLNIYGWWDLMKSIRAGEVVSDLCKPVDFYWLWQAKNLGRAGYRFLSRTLPSMAVFLLIYRLGLPGPWSVWPVFAVSLAMGYLIGHAWCFIYNALAFWILDSRGVGNVANALGSLMAGLLLPVAFFPAWLQRLASWTPFPSMLDTPVGILLGVFEGAKVWSMLGRQAAWLVIMVVLARWLAGQGIKRVVIQGG